MRAGLKKSPDIFSSVFSHAQVELMLFEYDAMATCAYCVSIVLMHASRLHVGSTVIDNLNIAIALRIL